MGARQQKRASEREAAKAKALKAPVTISAEDAASALERIRHIAVANLADRDVRGIILAEKVRNGGAERLVIDNENTTFIDYKGKRASVSHVARAERNDRGTMRFEYECDCFDFEKEGRLGCKHTFAERLLIGSVVVDGEVPRERKARVSARRGPARKRFSENGRPVRSTQSAARRSLDSELPRLVSSLVAQYRKEHADFLIYDGGGKVVSINHRPPTAVITRAAALVYKIAHRKGAESMQAEYARLIVNGHLRLKTPPCPNTLTAWMNDPEVTAALRWMLAKTAYMFRAREVGAMVDSSKVSQMPTAIYRMYAYEGDVRESAIWMRCHALVGIETMVCMAVEFASNKGDSTADVNFVKPLIMEARKQFNLRCLLADKAYFGAALIRWLKDEAGIQSFIPVKKKVGREEDGALKELVVGDPYSEMIHLYVNDQPTFHGIYRLRGKIEAFFSLLKRAADEHMWSRGRIDEATRQFNPVTDEPCTAWVNEALCKFVYMNLRTTNTIQEESNVTIDYTIPERCFPPAREPVLEMLAAA